MNVNKEKDISLWDENMVYGNFEDFIICDIKALQDPSDSNIS